MKLMCNCKKSLRKVGSNIHLIDKCLIIIMFLLLLQSAYSLFFNAAVSSEFNTIDIIVRTATASIFGYFLSSNFICHTTSETTEKKVTNEVTKETTKETTKEVSIMDSDDSNGIKNQIGFSGPDSKNSLDSGNVTFTPEQIASTETYTEGHLQIIITTSIAIFCLLVLTIIRNISGSTGADLTVSAQATISQFRDLVSGCIGFLIGVPTTRK